MESKRPDPPPSHATVVRLPHQWFLAAEVQALGSRRPLRIQLQGEPLVLFRDGAGRATALLDRCPHRNVPLSEGRVVAGGQLQCAYHGWRFDGAGACRAIPGRREEPDTPARRVPRYEVREQDGYVWVFSTPDAPPVGEPFRFPLLAEPGYAHVRRHFEVEATVHALVENTLDVPHTAFLHGGLFRSPERGHPLEVIVRAGADRVEASYVGEPRPGGLVGRLLAPGGGVVEHVDRFLMPSIAQVEYRLGESHLVTSTAFTPLDDFRTAVHTVVSFRLPLPAWLVQPFVAPIAERIFAQDARMLALQTRTLQRFGSERFASTELDAIGPLALRLMQRAAKETPEQRAAQGRADQEAGRAITERRFTLHT